MEFYSNTENNNPIVKYVHGCGTNGTGIISFFSCNLRCPFCFAQKYSYHDSFFVLDTQRRINCNPHDSARYIIEFLNKYPDICFIQLTGGEPLLNNSRMQETIETLKLIQPYSKANIRLIYQTNGIFIKDSDRLNYFVDNILKLDKLDILFELSLKGTNENEFYVLSGGLSQNLYSNQLKSYWLLKNICSKHINVVARLGTGHHRNTIQFIYPDTKKSMFLRDDWSNGFIEVYDDTTKRFGSTKMIAECINAEGDGSMNNYLHRSIPAISRCINSFCITTRGGNKAILRAAELVNQPFLNNAYSVDYTNDYNEFKKYFEPMGNPAHSYCGRNEFNAFSRVNCPKNCCFYPENANKSN